MGCGQSSSGGGGLSVEEKRQNAKIDDELKKARTDMRNEVKMLLLGAGESGKSTMLKQMRLMYREPYSPNERDAYREIVFSNALQSMQAVIKGYDAVEIELPPNVDDAATYLLSLDTDATAQHARILEPEVQKAIEKLWAEESTKQVVRQASKFQLNDSAQYFFEEIGRIGAPDYLPTDQDILRTRVRSTGIAEDRFRVQGYVLRVFDVGGQRSERKKWIHCFENVQMLVFVAAINEYDQRLWEDESVNRLDEACMLFESIAGSRWFEKSAFVLLLNKVDIFAEKVIHSPLIDHYPEYRGGSDLELAKLFILHKFISLDKKRDRRPLYTYFSCATDTAQVQVVMAAVMDTVLTNLLQEVGLM